MYTRRLNATRIINQILSDSAKYRPVKWQIKEHLHSPTHQPGKLVQKNKNISTHNMTIPSDRMRMTKATMNTYMQRFRAYKHSNSYVWYERTVVVSAIRLCVLSYFVLLTTKHTHKKTHIHLRVAFKPKTYIARNKCAVYLSHSPHTFSIYVTVLLLSRVTFVSCRFFSVILFNSLSLFHAQSLVFVCLCEYVCMSESMWNCSYYRAHDLLGSAFLQNGMMYFFAFVCVCVHILVSSHSPFCFSSFRSTEVCVFQK